MIFSFFELIQERSSKAKNTSINVSGLKGHYSPFLCQHPKYETVTSNVVTHPVVHPFN